MNRTYLKGMVLIFTGATIMEVLIVKASGRSLSITAKYICYACFAIIVYGGYLLYIHKKEKKDHDSNM